MQAGAITGYIDVAQVVLYVFWVFFAGLVYYLHRENKREGYPLESNVQGRNPIVGFPSVPRPKTYRLADGTTVTVPRPAEAPRAIAGTPTGPFPGAPLVPTGQALGAGIGPGGYALRRDIPDVTIEGAPRIVPLRNDPAFAVSAGDVDPRGLPVVGADGVAGGVVTDVWVDRSEVLFRYLEVDVGGTGAARREATVTPVATVVEVTPSSVSVATASVVSGGAGGAGGTGAGSGGRVLVPVNFARVGRRRVVVDSVMGSDLAGVPTTRHPGQVTLLEEERIMAYFGAGTLYASAARAEPML